ncbi:uncharacterized protein LOC115328690 [Ixodes scapularis]|uniref:uncharacterized protein LOC115328690 n=1 Tax=Ixodes scapularis TaxID=6945 RepID=UPI001A9E1F68|nr:uncharacterized protein LOC115328690 [Ixodes scapularis]
MLGIINKTPTREILALFLVTGLAICFYESDIHKSAFFVQRPRRVIANDISCNGTSVIEACRRADTIRVLFVVETNANNRGVRLFIRNSYAGPQFSSPLRWLTVLHIRGEPMPQMYRECSVYGDMVVLGPSMGFLHFAPWILQHCPKVELVVSLEERFLPHPFYLPNYRILNMDHRRNTVHCVVRDVGGTQGCKPGVMVLWRSALEEFIETGTEGEDRLVSSRLPVMDMSSYVSTGENMTMLYTIGAVVFYRYPEGLNCTMRGLWRKVIKSPDNNPGDLWL